jgi:hypothetical protein
MTHPQHILAELSTERCDGLRDDLEARLELCAYDELRVLAVILGRLELGRNRYGYLDLSKDKRNWKRERAEEAIDWIVYDAVEELERKADEAADRICREYVSPHSKRSTKETP